MTKNLFLEIQTLLLDIHVNDAPVKDATSVQGFFFYGLERIVLVVEKGVLMNFLKKRNLEKKR